MANAVRFAVDLSGLDERFATLGFQRTASVAGSNMFFGVVPESASQFFVVYHEPGPGQDGIEDFVTGFSVLVVPDGRALGLDGIREASILWARQHRLEDPVVVPAGWYMASPVVLESGRQRDFIGWELPSGGVILLLRGGSPTTSAAELLVAVTT